MGTRGNPPGEPVPLRLCDKGEFPDSGDYQKTKEERREKRRRRYYTRQEEKKASRQVSKEEGTAHAHLQEGGRPFRERY